MPNIDDKIREYFLPKRRALSRRYPRLAPAIIYARRMGRSLAVALNPSVKSRREEKLFPSVVTRHSSPLMRRLGHVDMRLQEQKVTNLRLAVALLDGVVIQPGKTFSLWQILGNPTYERGFVDGMLLSDGKVLEGVGGGLCQLSNLIHWAFLHAPVEIVERMHHSRDVFPDNNRTLPFGSGATIYYNLIDLRVRNTLRTPLQMHLWLTESDLRIQLLSPVPIPEKFHVHEERHAFVSAQGTWFRTNEIWRETRIAGELVKDEKLYENFAPVMYEVTDEYLASV